MLLRFGNLLYLKHIFQAKEIREKIAELREKLTKKDELQAAEVKEMITQLQNKSLKLFEAAYKKMASNQSPPPAEEQKSEGEQKQG